VDLSSTVGLLADIVAWRLYAVGVRLRECAKIILGVCCLYAVHALASVVLVSKRRKKRKKIIGRGSMNKRLSRSVVFEQ
jgi:hypothetical protein